MPRAWKAPLAADASVIGPGLTQVLADGSSTYLYGLGRIGEQQAAGWMHHLGDALSSVRQLADASVNVTLARSFEPFRDPLMTTGGGISIYGFTGRVVPVLLHTVEPADAARSGGEAKSCCP